MNRIFFKYVVMLPIALFILNSAAVAEDFKNQDYGVVGTVEEKELSWYAVINTGRGRKKLCTKGDIFCSDIDIMNCLRVEDIKKDSIILEDVKSKNTFTVNRGERIPVDGSEIIFEKAVQANVIEYTYREPKEPVKIDAKDFSVRDLGAKKVVLEKPYSKAAGYEKLSEEERGLFDSPRAIERESEKINAAFFEDIEVEKIGENTWEVNAEKADAAAANIGRALFSVIKKVEPRYRLGEGPSLKFNSELGNIVIGRDGFLVQDLGVVKLAERAGIKQGDLIKRVNGYPVNSLFGLYKVYTVVKSDKNVKIVNMDIIRNGRPETLVYKVR